MKIAFDVEEMKPGCVLIQAALGCDPNVADAFDPDDWIVDRIAGMKVYEVTEGQLVELVAKVKERHHA